jgi:predicted RNase H-like HicB family nuclease
MKPSVTFMVQLPFLIKKEGPVLISCCPVLDVWSQGETEKKAKENLIEAVRFFLEDCFERGTLEKVLKDCGFIPLKKRVRPQEFVPHKEIQVPLPFIIDQQLAQCRG